MTTTPTASTAPPSADFSTVSPIAFALAAQYDMQIVGCAKGFNVWREGDLLTSDCTPAELEQWLEGYDAGHDDARINASIPRLADQLLDAAFSVPRDPRSSQYKAGARAALAFRTEGAAIPQPYPAGSAKADAFSAGIEEGHAIWRRAQAAAAGAA